MAPDNDSSARAKQRFDWALPYPSRRQPVIAINVVATSQGLAVQAGVSIRQRGGNAIDAALAMAITLAVVEPCSNGIGSDLFAIIWDGQELAGLNASGRAPAAVTSSRYAGQTKVPERGWESVTIPGAVSGWATLSQRYGRLPFDFGVSLFRQAAPSGQSPYVEQRVGVTSGISYALPSEFESNAFALSYSLYRVDGTIPAVTSADPEDPIAPRPLRGQIGAATVGWAFSNPQAYTHSIGAERGFALSLYATAAAPPLASDFTLYTFGYSATDYLPMPFSAEGTLDQESMFPESVRGRRAVGAYSAH